MRARNWDWLVLLALFAIGIVHWVYFFHFGQMTFQGQDWPKDGLYLHVLRQAILTGTMPFHISREFQDTHRFLALPETILSPQILLLRFLEPARFMLVNTILLYAVGF